MLRMLTELNTSITQENVECDLQMNDYLYLYYSMEQSRDLLVFIFTSSFLEIFYIMFMSCLHVVF